MKLAAVVIAVVVAVADALSCRLPEPVVLGVRNGTAAAVPLYMGITNAQPEADRLFVVALHNGRAINWHSTIKIGTEGVHRILITTVALDQPCERVDLFVFETFDSGREDARNRNHRADALSDCRDTETHAITIESPVELESVKKLFQLLSALTEASTYPDAGYHLAVERILLVDSETDNHKQIRVVVIVTDTCPTYLYDLRQQKMASRNMLVLSSLLESVGIQPDLVRIPQSEQAASDEFERLFAMSASHLMGIMSDLSTPSTQELTRGVFITLWNRIFVAVGATMMLSALIQTEWHHFEADVPTLHAELAIRVLDSSFQTPMDVIHRAAFMGALHIALLVHIPADTKWFRGVLELHLLRPFRVINENSWHAEFPECSSVAIVASLLDATNTSANLLPSSASHAARIRRIEKFAAAVLDQPIIVVGASSSGPFTILDGNHRAVALTRAAPPDARVPVLIGVNAKLSSPHEGSFYCP